MAYYATYMPNELGELQKVVINAGVGFVLPYYGETAPPGTLACDGSEISREAFKELFQVLGTKAGGGAGVSTFNLPDMRGVFVRGTGGNAAALGERQGDAIRNITGYFIDYIFQPEAAIGGQYAQNGRGVFKRGNDINKYGSSLTINSSARQDPTPAVSDGMIFDASTVVPTAAENRPVNVALLWCIIYE